MNNNTGANTTIRLLATEHSAYPDAPAKSPSSNLMDIALLVAETDYYHLECQMHNDTQMVLRMISYDLHFSLQHMVSPDLSKEELTVFVKEIIVILEEDTAAGYLTPQESCDYIRLLLHASEHIFQNYPEHHEEVLQVTKPLIKLPSVELREAREALDKAYAEIADKDATIADKDATIADRDAEIAHLRKLLLI